MFESGSLYCSLLDNLSKINFLHKSVKLLIYSFDVDSFKFCITYVHLLSF